MKKMKKAVCILSVLLLFICFSMPISAEEQTEELYEKLPGEVKEQLDDVPKSSEGLLSYLSLKNLWDFLSDKLFGSFKAALSDFAIIMSILVLMMLVSSFQRGFLSEETLPAFELVAVLCIALAVFDTLQRGYSAAFMAVYDMALFQQSSLAVMAAAMAAGGNAISGSVLPVSVMLAVNLITLLNSRIFMPLLSVLFSLALAESIYPGTALGGLVGTFKKFIVWGIGVGAALMSGIISLQKSLTAASDSAVSGAVKLTVSSALPIMGSVIKEAYNAVAGSMGAIKAAAGVMGVLAVAILLLPSIIRAGVYSGLFKLCAAFSNMSDNPRTGALLKNISAVWEILFAIVVCEGMFTVFAVSMLLQIGGKTV